ncbi:MAG TPA: helix-turn-helix transcriptional regulator [Pseudomonadales bacterium]
MADYPATPTNPIESLTAFSQLLETLYASLWDNQGMEKSLIAFKEYFHSCSATLMALQQNPRHMRYGWTVGVPEKYERWYIENDMVARDPAVDLFESESPRCQGFVAASLLLGDIPLIDTVSDEFKPWLLSEEIVDSAGLLIPSRDNEFLILALQRNRQCGPFSEFELQQLNLLAPHIKQTVQLFIKFYRQQSDNSSLQAAINTLAQPTIVINELMQVRHINTAAEALIAATDRIRIEGDQILINDDDIHHQFMYHAWGLASRGAEALQNEFNSIVVVPGPNGNLTITLSPMCDPAKPGKSRGLLLQIYDPVSQQLPNAGRIQSVFNLSAAEAQACELLVQGHTTRDIAGIRHVSVNTVREQLRSIFKKTGFNRQSELIAAILRSTP